MTTIGRTAARRRFACAVLLACVALSGCLGRQQPRGKAPEPGVHNATNTPRIPACQPQALGDWQPQWVPPTAATPDACSDAQIDGSFRACASTKRSDAACDAFNNDPENLACVRCLLSDVRAPSYGPVIVRPRSALVNTPGCIAHLDGDSSGAGCAAKKQAALACEYAACSGPCGAEWSLPFYRCIGEADRTVCRTYVEAASCSQRAEYARCAFPTYGLFYSGIAKLWCGTGFLPQQ